MRCPYCRKKGAKILPGRIKPGGLIHSAIECKNPLCSAYNPIKYGFHPNMLPEKHAYFRKFLDAIGNE